MKNILSALYKGKIHPEEDALPHMPEFAAAKNSFLKHQEQLLSEMDEPMREKVLALLEERNAVSAYELEERYVRGMRMGALMAVELLSEDKLAE